MNSTVTPNPTAKFARPPIIEAVVDIDCDLPPGRNLAELLASQPFDGASPPMLLDITVGRAGPASPDD